MNTLDAVIIIITVISSLFGLWRGFVKEVLSLATWVAALIIARLLSNTVADLMVNWINNEGIRYVTAFALIFVAVMMAGTLVTHVMSKLLSLTGLKLADRLFGAAFGVARGVIIVLVAIFVARAFVSETQWWQESTLVPHGLALIERSRLFIEDSGALDLGS